MNYSSINKQKSYKLTQCFVQTTANARGALSEEALGSALFSAVRQDQHGMVTALTDSGANVNMCDERGYTPLLLSAELGHSEVFR